MAATPNDAYAFLCEAVDAAVAGDESLLASIPDMAKAALFPIGHVRHQERFEAVSAQLDRCIVAFPQPGA
jgi:hypothetical protein